MGYGINADTLEKAANEAQHYPYFLQVIGRELHRAAKSDPGKLGRGHEIGGAILKKALKKFRLARNNYYSGRYQELRARGILRSAEAVARLYRIAEEEFNFLGCDGSGRRPEHRHET